MSGSRRGVELVGVPPPVSYIITVASPDPDPKYHPDVSLQRAKKIPMAIFAIFLIRIII